ncbi:MAG: vWA domain-containing protein [Flammeovirgaceae bacterium]
MKTFRLICTLACLILGPYVVAQEGYSSASLSMNRANGVTTPDQVVVEEYLNYHRHQIPLPRGVEEVALSIDYQPLDNKQVIIQVGIATKKLIDYSNIPPINVALVIDRSGSMQSDAKLEKVKRALSKFIQGLRPNDYISIITYESAAQTVLSAKQVRTIANLDQMIQSIYAGGSTNLHGGLMLGYQEVQKNFDPAYTNKVILLTDGIANVGETNPEKIVKQSGFYNRGGIDVSTIGVGRDLNFSLLQQISKQGRGDNHFVGNSEEDITKVFENELESLLSPIGKEVQLALEYPEEMELKSVLGYSPTFQGRQIQFPLNNINNGLTQVFILIGEWKGKQKPLNFQAQLNYFSCAKQAKATVTTSEKLKLAQSFRNEEVLKNYQIAQMATALKTMALHASTGKANEAVATIDASLMELKATFPHLRDNDLIRVRDILLANQGKLNQFMMSKNR